MRIKKFSVVGMEKLKLLSLESIFSGPALREKLQLRLYISARRLQRNKEDSGIDRNLLRITMVNFAIAFEGTRLFFTRAAQQIWQETFCGFASWSALPDFILTNTPPKSGRES